MKPDLHMMRRYIQDALTCQGEVATLGEKVFDEESGDYIYPRVVTYSGSVLVRPMDNDARVVEAGGMAAAQTRYQVNLPAGTHVEIDNKVLVTSSPDAPSMVGLELTIVDAPLDAWEVSRKCIGVVVTI